jgi:hypothetical protein
MMADRDVVRFDVRWTVGQRVFQWIMALVLGAIAAGVIYLYLGTDEMAELKAEPGGILYVAWLPALLFFCTVGLMLLARYDVWLDGDRLVRQGIVGRRSIALRTATYAMKETTWSYTRRLGPMKLRRLTIVAPTLVVRSSRLRGIPLPLARRTGHAIVGDRVVVAWLPQHQLGALAEAIERHGSAPNTAKVAQFLRGVATSGIQPRGSAEIPLPP